jgi:hypothetical protein
MNMKRLERRSQDECKRRIPDEPKEKNGNRQAWTDRRKNAKFVPVFVNRISQEHANGDPDEAIDNSRDVFTS